MAMRLQAGAVRVEGITAGAFDEMTDTGKTKAMKQLDSEAMCAHTVFYGHGSRSC